MPFLKPDCACALWRKAGTGTPSLPNSPFSAVRFADETLRNLGMFCVFLDKDLGTKTGFGVVRAPHKPWRASVRSLDSEPVARGKRDFHQRERLGPRRIATIAIEILHGQFIQCKASSFFFTSAADLDEGASSRYVLYAWRASALRWSLTSVSPRLR